MGLSPEPSSGDHVSPRGLPFYNRLYPRNPRKVHASGVMHMLKPAKRTSPRVLKVVQIENLMVYSETP
jgi:hypothetical protein